MSRVRLHPSMRPLPSPIDFPTMAAAAFRKMMRDASDYLEIKGPSGAVQYRLHGAYTVRDRSEHGNKVYVRLVLEDDGGSIGHLDMSATTCVELAHHLLMFAICAANVNAVPQVISEAMVKVFEAFLHPQEFAKISGAFASAAEESIRAKIALEQSRTAKC